MKHPVILAAGALAFVLLATANSGGYRYGISDQAYYVPAVMRAADPSLFPRDAPLLDAQSGNMLIDDVQGTLARGTGLDMPALALALYLVTLVVTYGAALALARAGGFSAWATTAFLLLLTFRHRIAKTGANSLEGYAHPRMLAFALGMASLACLLRQRWGLAGAAVLAAAVIHPTTGLWFGIVVSAALFVGKREWRPWLAAGVLLAGAATLWAATAGPLAARLVQMDDAWLSVLAEKDYLFPAEWPAYAWVLNLLYPVVILAIYRARARAGETVAGERAVMTGVIALTLVFLASVPFTVAKIALVVQLQVNRVFWVLDVLAAASIAWWLTRPGPGRARSARPGQARLGGPGRARPLLVVGLLMMASVGRGVFLLVEPNPNRALVSAGLPATPWVETLSWIEEQPARWQVLADPDHAWKFGISVRLGARRDTVLEIGKDSALAMYDRGVAMRVAERAADLSGFDGLDADRALALGDRYDADVAIVERARTLPLPILHANDAFVVHDLRR